MPHTGCHFSIERIYGRPYIKEVIDYELNQDKTEGSIEYNGYFYVGNGDLPLEYREMYLYKTELTSGDDTGYRYRFVFNYKFRVEIYKHEQYEDMSQTYDDPVKGRICLTPTNRERIWFRILENAES